MIDPITLIDKAITALKLLKEMNDVIKNTQVKTLVSSAYSDLADARVELSTIKIENSKLKEELYALNNIKKNLILKNHLYFRKDLNIYCCPHCYENDDKCISLTGITNNNGNEYFKCETCNRSYPNYYDDGANLVKIIAKEKGRTVISKGI